MVGFRFPDYPQGFEVVGYHLHFVDADRRRGGHVLTGRTRSVTVGIDHASDLHVECPRRRDARAPERGRGGRGSPGRGRPLTSLVRTHDG